MRGGRLVLDGVSLACEAGATLIIRGANGAGKSTLLRVIAGLLDKQSGDVHLDGVADEEEQIAAYMHYVGHLDAVKSALTVRENLTFWQRYYGSAHVASVDQALDAFALTQLSDLPAQYLSAGQKKRLGLARLLVAHRPVWLLDEPTVSLDTDNRARLAKVITAHTQAQGLALVASHDALDLDNAQQFRLDSQKDGGDCLP